MSRPARTRFAWEANPGEPFIDIRWDYRRGMVPSRRALAVGRLASIAVVVVFWALVLRGCGGLT